MNKEKRSFPNRKKHLLINLKFGLSNLWVLNLVLYLIASVAITLPSHAQTLETYQQIAAENNPGLQAKYKSFEAALQKIPQVSTLPDPTLSLGYFLPSMETTMGSQIMKLTLTQMFPWFGTLKAQGDAAALLAEAEYQSFLDVRNNLYYQVSAAWYPLYELNRLKLLEQENIEILESYKNIATVNFQNGKGAMADVLRVDIMLKEASTNLQILNVREKPLLTTFNKLLSRDGDETVLVQDSLSISPLPENYRKDSLLADNPVLKELELKRKANEAAEQAAIKQGLPQIGVGLEYMIIEKLSGMSSSDNGKDELMPMVSVTIPIFRKKYKASVKEKQLLQESFTLQKADYSNRLVTDYESILFEIEQQQKLLDLYDQQIETAEQTLNLLFTAYGNSGKEFEEVLRMQQQLLQYDRSKASALTNYYIAVARLNYLTAYEY